MIDIFNTVVDFLRNVFTTVGLNNVLIASIAVLLFAITGLEVNLYKTIIPNPPDLISSSRVTIGIDL